jgi:6-phospho-beta-glucosidase
VAIGIQRHVARLLDIAPARVMVDQVGLNHLTWVRAVRVDGADVLPDLLVRHGEELGPPGIPRWVLEDLRAIPSYYLRYFYAHDAVLTEQRNGAVPRAEQVAEIERELLELYRDPALREKPALLEQRGGAYYSEAAVGLVASLSGDEAIHVVDTRNNGTLAGLADDDVVEVPARVSRDGVAPLAQDPLAPELLGLVQHVAAYERLTAQAAVTRDQVTARKALLAHPLIGQHEMVLELSR